MTPLQYTFLFLLPLFTRQADAIWPFKQKRFMDEAFIDAGTLGLEDLSGRVVAHGDWDGDQKLDIFTLSEDRKTVQIYQWHKERFKYVPSHGLTIGHAITNVVPGDFNHDGKLDLLVMYELGEKGGWWSGSKEERTGMAVYLGGGERGAFQPEPWSLPAATGAHPIIYDADGSLRPSLLGWEPTESGQTPSFKSWQNTGDALRLQSPPFLAPDQVCELANPHSSAFVDIDGDCRPDLVLHCARPRSTHQYIQMWLNNGAGGFELAKSYDLPKGSGPLSFADMDRDGTLDIVFPVCGRVSSSTGAGSDCSINIAYNRQVPICSGLGSEQTNNGAGDSQGLRCRGWGNLCVGDRNFAFSFEPGSETFSSIAFSLIFASDTDLMMHVAGNPSIPLPVRPSDFNVDGFPDLLLVISNDTAIPSSGGIFGGSRGTQARVLENVGCHKGIAGCDGNQGRGLKVGSGKGWEVLDVISDVTGASWLDVDDDGSLDIMLQRAGANEGPKVSFIKNNFYHDAFFLKAQVLNGACDRDCQPAEGGKKYSPLGVSYSGASYKFTVLDTLGRRVAQQAAQLPQTGYHALGTPYSFIGLGRTNNYVERLFVGSSLRDTRYPGEHQTILESLIPNSQVIINPPSPAVAEGETPPAGPVKLRSIEWRSELFLHPGDWVPWVGAAVVGTVILLGTVVLFLDKKEKREDEKERQRALHAINFQAL